MRFQECISHIAWIGLFRCLGHRTLCADLDFQRLESEFYRCRHVQNTRTEDWKSIRAWVCLGYTRATCAARTKVPRTICVADSCL